MRRSPSFSYTLCITYQVVIILDSVSQSLAATSAESVSSRTHRILAQVHVELVEIAVPNFQALMIEVVMGAHCRLGAINNYEPAVMHLQQRLELKDKVLSLVFVHERHACF